ASARSHDDLGLVLIELGLGDADGFGEILVGQLRIDDLVAVLGEEGRFDASRDRLPAVKEEDFHGADSTTWMPGGANARSASGGAGFHVRQIAKQLETLPCS